MDNKQQQVPIEVLIDSTLPTKIITKKQRELQQPRSILTRLHAGYFRISLSLCSQALIWKTLGEQRNDDLDDIRRVVQMLPSATFILLWAFSLFILSILSVLYTLKCIFYFDTVKAEFLDDVGVNYLFAPWISWLLLLEAAPFTPPQTTYVILWWAIALPIVALDVKIYGQWFTKGRRFLSSVANPTSQLSVLGNLVCARTAAEIGWKEIAISLFSLSMAHYLVLFVTLYQRFSASDRIPAMLRPVFFLFFAAPSMASLAWCSIIEKFDTASKMLFFLSLFLFFSLVSRPSLFKKSMRRFNVAWWAYSYTLTVLALASAEYAEEVNSRIAHVFMLMLSALSALVTLGLLLSTALNSDTLMMHKDDQVFNDNSKHFRKAEDN
ncbi:hypothetical protein ACHQM5_016104 [Ranunculus cassubicifolius]